jgi:hypothetical protein
MVTKGIAVRAPWEMIQVCNVYWSGKKEGYGKFHPVIFHI